MAGVRSVSTLLVVITVLVIAVLVGVLGNANEAGALPPAGQDLLNVSGEASIASRLGQETIQLEGLVTIAREDPHMDGDVEVVDVEVIAIELSGQSITGSIVISESPSLDSIGEIRSLQPPPDEYPASVAFDLYMEVGIPVSGGRSAPTIYNDVPLELAAVSPIEEWPPVGAQFQAEPDAPEGSHCSPPDGPGGLPLLPLLPSEFCVISVSMTLGEPKTPTPTLTPCPAEVCTPTPSPLPPGTTAPTNTPGPTSTPAPTLTPTPTPAPDCALATASGNVFSQVLPVPLDIPDGSAGGVGACILISDSTTVEDLNVELQISHEWVGDLVITLFHEESGTSLTLIDRPGRPADGFGFGCSRDDLDVMLDDEASLPAEDQCTDPPAISGSLWPHQPLSAFDGDAILGSWFITVADVSGGGAGTLNAWALYVNEPDVLIGDTNCDGAVNAIDAALTLQLGAGLLSSLACQAAGDVNQDGAINALDAALILQFAAGLVSQLPP